MKSTYYYISILLILIILNTSCKKKKIYSCVCSESAVYYFTGGNTWTRHDFSKNTDQIINEKLTQKQAADACKVTQDMLSYLFHTRFSSYYIESYTGECTLK